MTFVEIPEVLGLHSLRLADIDMDAVAGGMKGYFLDWDPSSTNFDFVPTLINWNNEAFDELNEIKFERTDILAAILIAAILPDFRPPQEELSQASTLNRAQASSKTRRIDLAVIREFIPVPEVSLIYSDRCRAERVYSLFTEGSKYDDQLMDHLLGRELAILDRFPGAPITFKYFSLSASTSPRDIIPNSASLIFED